jgi:outer membrane biosynthesis protein TonB
VLPALSSRRAHSSPRAATPALVATVTASKALTCLGECRCEDNLAIERLLIYGYRLISALIITPVGAYFLWPSPSGDAHHGHEEHHEEHHEEAEAKEEEQPQEEESKDEESKEEESKDEQPDEKHPQEEGKDVSEKTETEKTEQPSGTEGESQDRADANKKSSGDEEAEVRAPTSGPASTEGVSGKGHMKNDSDGHNQSSKREPDGKGGFKNRKDSGLQKELTPNVEGSNSVSLFLASSHLQSYQRNHPKVLTIFLSGRYRQEAGRHVQHRHQALDPHPRVGREEQEARGRPRHRQGPGHHRPQQTREIDDAIQRLKCL